MSNALLEEYKALRDEIKRNEGEGLQVILLLVTSAFTFVGFKMSPPLLPLWLLSIILQIALVIGLAQYLDSLRLRIRLSKYIQVFLESTVDDLNWETRQSHFNRKENDSLFDGIARQLYNTVLNVFSILFVSASIFSWKAFYESYKNCESPHLFCLLLIVLIVLNISTLKLTIMIIRARYFKEYRKSFDESCVKLWTKIKENEESAS